MQSPEELEQHAWLRQLVGEWIIAGEMTMGGATETWKSRERIRAIGEFWIVAETTVEGDGEPFVSILTLGFDPKKEVFVGSWIDTCQTTMWSLSGRLDESGRVLTLEAEGPSLADPSQTATYRDRIELVTPDRKRTTSSMLGEDGGWSTFMTMEARRLG